MIDPHLTSDLQRLSGNALRELRADLDRALTRIRTRSLLPETTQALIDVAEALKDRLDVADQQRDHAGPGDGGEHTPAALGPDGEPEGEVSRS